ncbi:sulfatase-like hydrolase/transferase [Pseudomonas sp. TTU2014-080ASC]|uniref:sulfatase-like hydrolase/transferase n=1 Tax=Pseudomonas sp. TTU2014-080ASC TaxID=1729724 RepID=UPI0007184B02|nr:sulfatase-like hydrolase/transferase [Pseudomonas sp. TTU2014-080ASC]KRW62559.1 sulfatase [Pseudomonas sp. TTU2014-080ASC]
MQESTSKRPYRVYWSLVWLLTALNLGRFYELSTPFWLLLYQVALIGSYALMFIAIPCLITRVTRHHLPALTAIIAVLSAALVQLTLYFDSMLWQLYGFHINGFVWNLLTTPGGLAALVTSPSTEQDLTLLGLSVLALYTVLLLASFFLARIPLPLPRAAWVIPLFLLVTSAERLTYSMSHFYGYSPVLESAQATPFYQPLTMRRLLEQRLGLERPQHLEVDGVELKGQLRYPQEPLKVIAPQKPLNLVWLVAESWRADALNPKVMPQTYGFANQAQNFTRHYSGGNGTRMGMFSQFYGLAANLWFPVLDARIGSPLIEALQQQNYQLKLFTSARFSYPEYDKTMFVKVPAEQMIADYKGPTWQRDRRNVERMLEFVDNRDPAKPFMTFMFFESAHANYDFPPESVIAKDYLPDFSSARVDLDNDIEGIRNRYLNAVHHLDSQIARVIQHLKRKGLLNNTIVVLTGDHGEEFMERGRWGHNSAFTDEQLRVPLILHVPGRAPFREALRTSHVDLLPTLLPLLGVTNPPEQYSIGYSLFNPQPRRTLMAGEWDSLAFMTEQYKLVVPFSSANFDALKITDANDSDTQDPQAVLQQLLPQVQEQMRSLRNFLAR